MDFDTLKVRLITDLNTGSAQVKDKQGILKSVYDACVELINSMYQINLTNNSYTLSVSDLGAVTLTIYNVITGGEKTIVFETDNNIFYTRQSKDMLVTDYLKVSLGQAKLLIKG